MAQHTPGPWKVGYNGGVTGSGACCHDWSQKLKCPVVYSSTSEYGKDNPHPIILISGPIGAGGGGGNGVLAHVIPEPDSCFGGTNGDANARLIAAAPRMHDYIAARAATGDSKAQAILREIYAGTEGK